MNDSPGNRREIVLVTRSEGRTTDGWDRVERVSKALSLAMLPIILAVGGWWVQRLVQDQAVRRDYVQLAVSILSKPDTGSVNPGLRAWAVDLLNEHSPTPLPEPVRLELTSGRAQLPRNASVATPVGVALNIRQRPSVESPVVGILPPGAPISVRSCQNRWCFIQSGRVAGFVWKDFVIQHQSVPDGD